MPTQHIGHGTNEIAYHVEWEFRREAFVWSGDAPAQINFHPYATELRSWLLRRGTFTVLRKEDRATAGVYTNPHTWSCSSLVVILAHAMDDSHAIATSTAAITALDAEVQRVRVMNEQVLYVTRICEALIKQLPYCTQVPKSYYKKAALGALLSTECRGCRGSGMQRHRISLLGSLAHRYGLCIAFEQCAMEHLKLVNRRRNVEAAHSDVPILDVRTPDASRDQLKRETIELGNEFVHLLRHISDLEDRIGRELDAISRRVCKTGECATPVA